MKNTCLFYIVCHNYKIRPPSSFISYLLVYIVLFNGFTQVDLVVSCTKMNLHHHYPLHLQNWTALGYILKEVWVYPPFVLDQPNPVSHKHKPNYLRPFLKQLSDHQCKASVTLLLLALSEEETCNSVLIFILIHGFDVTCTLGSLYLIQLNSLWAYLSSR